MILVTGGTGNIGRAVVEALRAEKRAFRVLTRDPARAKETLGDGVPLVAGDLDEPASLVPALEGAEKAFFVSHAGPELGRTARAFAEAAARAGVRHVVAVSSGTIHFEPPTTIGRWHLELEEAVKAYETRRVAWTFLRPGNFDSNSLRWAPTIRSASQVFAPHGDRRSSPIDPRDIGAVAAVALIQDGHAGKTHTLTGPELLTTRDQVETLSRVLERPIRFVEVPEERARTGMVGSGMTETMADAILELLRAAETGTTTTIRDVTGREARTYEAWVRDHAAAFR